MSAQDDYERHLRLAKEHGLTVDPDAVEQIRQQYEALKHWHPIKFGSRRGGKTSEALERAYAEGQARAIENLARMFETVLEDPETARLVREADLTMR